MRRWTRGTVHGVGGKRLRMTLSGHGVPRAPTHICHGRPCACHPFSSAIHRQVGAPAEQHLADRACCAMDGRDKPDHDSGGCSHGSGSRLLLALSRLSTLLPTALRRALGLASRTTTTAALVTAPQPANSPAIQQPAPTKYPSPPALVRRAANDRTDTRPAALRSMAR